MAAENEEGKQAEESEEEVENEVVEHTNVLYSGTLPGPNNNVPTTLNDTPLLQQRTNAEELFTFLKSENVQYLDLNGDDTPRVALISIPLTKMVRVIYSLGMGSSGIGRTNALANKFLMLTGDGGKDIGPPTPLVLPRSIGETVEVHTMSHVQFVEKTTAKGPNYSYPLIPRNQVNTTSQIMLLAPIPAFLVYDGFMDDLDAAEVYERILAMNDHTTDVMTHAKSFLLSCLSSHNIGDNKPHIPPGTFMTPLPPQAKVWAGNRFKNHFPSIALPNPVTALTTPGVDPNIAALLASLLPTAVQNSNRASDAGEEKKDDGGNTSTFSNQELQSTLAMCGEPMTGTINELPPWFGTIAEKGMNEQFKLTVIRKHLMENMYYDDADVPLSTPLLKMALKRSWVGKDGNIRRPSLIHATDGLSPFVCLELDEDEVARINEDEDTLQRASHITFQDLKNFKTKMTAKVPELAADYMLLLKRYANLLFALFSANCPHFKCVLRIINALKTFSKAAKDNMTTRTKASILWIILLQARQFSIGEMDILAEFTTMHSNLSAKMGNITHAEVPVDLYQIPTPKRQKPDNDPRSEPPFVKKQRSQQPSVWHPKLKEKLAGPMRTARNPALHAIMKYCGKSVEELYPKFGNRCTPNAVLGRCWAGDKCTREHKTATDAEATEITTLLTKFIDNPSGLLEG